jgi:hypothetical protein
VGAAAVVLGKIHLDLCVRISEGLLDLNNVHLPVFTNSSRVSLELIKNL